MHFYLVIFNSLKCCISLSLFGQVWPGFLFSLRKEGCLFAKCKRKNDVKNNTHYSVDIWIINKPEILQALCFKLLHNNISYMNVCRGTRVKSRRGRQFYSVYFGCRGRLTEASCMWRIWLIVAVVRAMASGGITRCFDVIDLKIIVLLMLSTKKFWYNKLITHFIVIFFLFIIYLWRFGTYRVVSNAFN